MTKALRNQSETVAVNSIRGFLNRSKKEIAAALPKHLTADRMLRLALTEFRRTPKLTECDPKSVIGAVIQASQLGLEIGTLGQAYLVPFKNHRTGLLECQFIPGYRGLIALAIRSGAVSKIEAHEVRQGDRFDYSYGLNEKLDHRPSDAEGDRPITHVYAIAKMKDGSAQFQVLNATEIERARTRSKTPNEGPWKDDFPEMAKKTVIRKLSKYIPVSVEMQRAFEREDEFEKGVPQNTGEIFDLPNDDFRDVDEGASTLDAKEQANAAAAAVANAEKALSRGPVPKEN